MLHRPRPVALKHSVKAKKPFTVNNSKPVGKEKKKTHIGSHKAKELEILESYF